MRYVGWPTFTSTNLKDKDFINMPSFREEISIRSTSTSTGYLKITDTGAKIYNTREYQ